MARRNGNGEGSIYQRASDKRWVGSIWVETTSGKPKRVYAYGMTRAGVHEKLTELKSQAAQGIPTADKSWKLGEYLDYWLREVVKPNLRLSTYERYEIGVRLYLKPGLGENQLVRLSVPLVQTFLNERSAAGMSVRSIQILREILRSALTRACEEEIVSRNVARFVKLKKREQADIRPWTLEEAKLFLEAARTDPLYPMFVLLVLYGLRRGEVLGLLEKDVDFENSVIRVRQQVGRIAGALRIGPVKTKAGRRDLPMLGLARSVLENREPTGGLLFTTKNGTAIEPRNFVRSFQRICERSGIRRITVHQVRHTTATLLKDLGVPARDAQLILGHSDIAITQQIYQHDSMEGRREALSRVETALNVPTHQDTQTVQPGYLVGVFDSSGCCQNGCQGHSFMDRLASIISGTPGKIRTCDTWFRSSIRSGETGRITEAAKYYQARRRQALLGVVAVSAAVKDPRAEEVALAA
ncbi:site-specific integrase [Streptomyces sp. NBC_00988]|uniref:tyrosine-type recombinase/integrase n=1 Tax=Streptomyces sp. NBC_00988 TaxID=2903704 RepID=UPI00386B0E5C|nr:site-specific integrase [Streptomyces sp. NBC_00988]